MKKYIVKDLAGRVVLKTLDPTRASDRIKKNPGFKLVVIPEAR